MSNKFIINSNTGSYGWAKAYTASGSTSFYAGYYKPGTNSSTHQYDASIGFKTTSITFPWGDDPFIIKKITLCTKKGGLGNVYNNLDIFLSETETAYPGAYIKEPEHSIGIFNGERVEITDTDALKQITLYLQNKTTFYLHITKNQSGGNLYGYNKTEKPFIIIDWEFSASTGFLNTTNFLVGNTVNLTLNVKGTGYTHQVNCYINDFLFLSNPIFSNLNSSLDKITVSPGTYVSSINFSPSISDINNWFEKENSVANGYFEIITKRDEEQVGETERINFSITLTKNYCESIGYLKLDDITFNYKSEQQIKAFIANRSIITVTCNYTKNENVKIKSINLTVKNGLLGTVTNNQVNEEENQISLETVIGTQALQASFVLVDERGFSYSKNITSELPQNYNEIQLSNLNFYRSDGNTPYVLGEKIGCDFRASTDFPGNIIQEIYVSYAETTYSRLQNINEVSKVFSSTDLFGNEYSLLTNSSYTLTIGVKDLITSDTTLYGNENYYNGYYTTTVTVPKASYIIHIPKGGNGIAFGTAYTDMGTKAYIDMGWPVKNLKIENNSGLKFFDIDVNSLDSFQKAIGGPFVSLSGTGKEGITGAIKIVGSSGLANNKDYLLLDYSTVNGSIIGSVGNITTITSSGLLKHYDGESTYNVATIGKNIFYAAEEIDESGLPTGRPSGLENPEEGMIWLKPII